MKSLLNRFSYFILAALVFISCSDNSVQPQSQESTARFVGSSTQTGEAAMQTVLKDLKKIKANPGGLEMYTIENGNQIPVDIDNEIDRLKS
jgi:hypothetical protein